MFPKVGSRPNSRSCPVVSIQAAVLNGFGDMAGLDAFQAVQVGQSSGDFQNAIVRASVVRSVKPNDQVALIVPAFDRSGTSIADVQSDDGK
jgi:hypothetical protein